MFYNNIVILPYFYTKSKGIYNNYHSSRVLHADGGQSMRS